jgi:hypothetical protein
MAEEKGRGIGGLPDATVKIALEVKGTVGNLTNTANQAK